MPKKEEQGFPLPIIAACSLISTLLFFAMLLIFSAVVLKTSASQSLYLVYGLAAGAVSGFINGFAALKLIKEKGLIFGAVCGLVQSVVSALVIFIMNKGTAGNGIFILIALMILFSSLGGLASVNLKKKIKY